MRAAVGILLAVAATAAPLTFSHKLHTKLMACRDCHALAAASTEASDNLLPAVVVCEKCHKGMAAPERRTTTVVHFSHSNHLKTANPAAAVQRAIAGGRYMLSAGAAASAIDAANACTACHRDVAEPDSPGRSALARMSDCLVCHSKIDPPESCAQCHAESAHLKPASHTPDFIDIHTTGKLRLDKTTCAVCHGRRFTCLGCH